MQSASAGDSILLNMCHFSKWKKKKTTAVIFFLLKIALQMHTCDYLFLFFAPQMKRCDWRWGECEIYANHRQDKTDRQTDRHRQTEKNNSKTRLGYDSNFVLTDCGVTALAAPRSQEVDLICVSSESL